MSLPESFLFILYLSSFSPPVPDERVPSEARSLTRERGKKKEGVTPL
jgi:hypothetical protein